MVISVSKIRKIISLVVVLFLIFTVFFQSVSSEGLFSGFKEKTRKVVDNIKDKTKQVINNVKEQISSDDHELKTSSNNPFLNKIKYNPIIKSILSYGYFKSNSALFEIYTKYGEFEKESSIGLGIPLLIDINNDGRNDVKAKVGLRFGIEKPFAISLKFNLQVTRLKGIFDLDEHLEVSLQLRFPGFLDESLKGNKVRFGILSEKYEEIPDNCAITYKYIPYVFSKEKPVHSTVLDPGNIEGDDELNILFSYVDVVGIEDENVDTFNVKLEPAVKTEMTLTGFEKSLGRSFEIDTTSHTTAVVKYSRASNESIFDAGLIIYRLSSFNFDVELTPFKKGGGRIEYQRQSSKPVEVLLFFENTNNSNYFFAEDIPSHIKVSWNSAENNLIKVDTFGERCSSVGWRNALLDEDVTAKAYLSNLPSYIELNWIGKLADGEIELSTNIGGCSAHVYASEFGNDAFISADIYSGDSFDFSVYWDFSRQVFGISRSNMDLSFDVSFYNLLNMNETADISFEIENEITSPFEFFLDEILDYDAKIEFTGNNFEIKNVDVDMDIPSIGQFQLKMNSFEMTRQSSVYFAFSVDETEDEIEVNCNIHVSNGVSIRGLIVGFNEFLYPVDDIVVNGEYDHTVNLSITEGFVDFHFNEDGSGYIVLSGGMSLFVDSDYYNDYNVLMAHVEGTVAFLSEDDSLNISWDASGALTIDGSGVVSLTGFNLWVKDKVDLSIPAIVGSFTFNAEDNTGSLNLVLSKSTMTLVSDFSIKIEDFEEITVKADFSIDGSVGLSGRLKISWGPEGVTFETVGVGVGINGDFTVSDLYFKMGSTIELSTNRMNLNGNLNLDVSLYLSSGGLSVGLNSAGASISVSNFNIDAPGLIVASFNEFYLGGSGFINVGSSSSYKLLTADVSGRVRVMGLYISSNSFGLPSPIQLSFKTDLSGAGQVVYLANIDELTVDVWGTKPLTVNNFYLNLDNGQLLVSWDKLNIDLSAHSQIIMSSGEIDFDASLSYVDFENFEASFQNTDMSIDGEITLTYSGELMVKGSIGDTVSIDLVLESGSLDINNLLVSVSGDDSSVEASWNNFHLDGNVDFDFSGSKSSGFNIGASGKGSFSVNNLDVNGNLPSWDNDDDSPTSANFNIEVGYFNLDLDDAFGSAMDLMFSDIFQINSASVSGAITHVELTDLYTHFDELNNPDPDSKHFTMVNISSLDVNFEGDGYFDFKIVEPDQNGVQEITINGQLSGNGGLFIDKMLLMLGPLWLDFEEFSISDFTQFHINAKGNIDQSNQDILDKILDFSFDAGCDSTWSAKKLDIIKLIGFDDFEGQGDLSLGVEINDEASDSTDDYFVLDLDGSWDWNDLKIILLKDAGKDIPAPRLGVGSFDGNTIFKVDLDLFLKTIGGTGDLTSGDIKIIAESLTNIDFLGLGNTLLPGLDWLFDMIGPVEFEAGIYSVAWNINILLGKGNADYEGFVSIDTDDNWITLPLTIKETFKLYGRFRSQDWKLEWNFSENRFWDKVNVSGDIDLQPGAGIALYLDDSYRTLMGSNPKELNANFIDFSGPMDHQHPGDKFKVIVADGSTNNCLSGAKAEYLWSDGSSQGQVLYTGSNGRTPYFTCCLKDGQSHSDCKIKVTHDDYPSPVYLDFHVESCGNDLYVNAGGPYYQDPGENVDFTGSASNGVEPYSWHWSFGNGDTSNEKKPSYSYQSEGTYTVTLTVTDSNGESNSDTTQANIETTNQPPNFGNPPITGPSAGKPESLLDFTAHATDPDGDPIEYKWKKSTPSGIPMTTGWFTENTWSPMWNEGNTPAYHWVKIKVRDNQGHETDWSDPHDVTITDPPVADPGGPYSGVVNQPLSFDGSGSYDPDGSIQSYEWDFDDGSTGSGETTTHTYTSPGTYFVELTVTDQYGITDSDTTTQIRIASEGEWISPTFDSDPDSFWNDETNASDGNSGTYSESNKYKKLVYEWSSCVYFDIPSDKYNKVKFKAFYDSTYCNKIRVEGRMAHDGSWWDLYEGSDFPNRAFTTKTFSTRTIDKVRVSFYMKSWSLLDGPTAELFEIEVFQITY